MNVTDNYDRLLHLDYVRFAFYSQGYFICWYLLKTLVTSLISLTSSYLAIVPSSIKCFLITGRLGIVGFPILIQFRVMLVSFLTGVGIHDKRWERGPRRLPDGCNDSVLYHLLGLGWLNHTLFLGFRLYCLRRDRFQVLLRETSSGWSG